MGVTDGLTALVVQDKEANLLSQIIIKNIGADVEYVPGRCTNP
jgi:hypothetical protein